MARVFKVEVIHRYAALLCWGGEVQRCSFHCLLALVLSPPDHQQESCLKYCVMPGKLRLQSSSRLHHINSLSLLSASCSLLTHREGRGYLFRTSPWEFFWSLHVSSVCCYVGLCTNEVVDCDQVKVPGNTVEVVTGHAPPV